MNVGTNSTNASQGAKGPAATDSLFSGGGEMGERIRAFDWNQTPLGPVETWSPSLKMMVRFILANGFPQLLWWGPQFVQIYNDAYRPVLGAKHPSPGLGHPGGECWSEIWHILVPLVEKPFRGGPPTWMEDIPLEIQRHGFTEETHFTIGYGAVPDDTVESGIGGVLATVHEITEKVVGERRVIALRDLGATLGKAKTAEHACEIAAATLAAHDKDVPFILFYLLDPDRKCAHLRGACGASAESEVAPSTIAVRDVADEGWPVGEALRTGTLRLVEKLNTRFTSLPTGPWSDPPDAAVIVPIPSIKMDEPAGIMIAGVSARLRFDAFYRDFFELIRTHVATAITNARAYEEERKRAEALAKLDRAKTEFFSNVSHEFRTPLTLMLGPLEEVLTKGDDALAPEIREQLVLTHRNSLRLMKLVNTLLDFSRIEAGRVRASYEPVDLAKFTAELSGVFRAAVEKAGLKLIVDCPPLPQPVYVDREMWEKIVLNLLSNAFKFTFHGEIEIKLRAVDGRRIQMAVRDTGTGIPQEELPRVFERFHRVRDAQSRTQEGTGIGLALVQEMVRLHGGDVCVSSNLGAGTTFVIGIPIGTAHLPSEQIKTAPGPRGTTLEQVSFAEEALRWLPGAGHKFSDVLETGANLAEAAENAHYQGAAKTAARARILLADDNSDMREYVTRLLRSAHYEVTAVSDGNAALKEVLSRRPDLILCDVMMPGLDGFGLLREVRASDQARTIPIILLSARAGEESRVEGLERGADDYLVKPFSARELLVRIESHLSLARLRSESEEQIKSLNLQLENDLVALGRIHRVRTNLIGSKDLKARLSEILSAAVDLTGTDKGNIQIYDPESKILRIVVHQGFGESFLKQYLDQGAPGLCDLAAKKVERIVWEDISEEPLLQGTEDLKVISGDGIRAVQCTPLVGLDGRLVGMLNTHYRNRYRPSERDLRHLDLLARMASDFFERWHAKAELTKSEARYRALVTTSSDVVYRMNGDWTEMRFLKGEEFLADTSKSTQNWFEKYILPEDRSVVEGAIRSAIETKSPFKLEHRVIRVDGTVGWTLSRAVPLLDENDEIIEWFGAASDITERKEAETRLETLVAERTAKLRETVQELEAFSYSIAHDMRAPLRGIQGFAKILADDYTASLDATGQNLLRRMSASANRMDRLILDVLTYSKVVQAQLPLEHIDLKQLLQGILDSYPQFQSDVADVSMEGQMPKVIANPAALTQVLSNLIGNAVKFVAPGVKPIVRISSLPKGEHTRILIRDNGIGIAADQHEKIFGIFQRAEKKYEGTGIGLAIVKKALNRMGGSVGLVSEPGKGSTFWIELRSA